MLFVFLFPNAMLSQSWDCDCEYNKEITLTRIGSTTLTDYQVRIEVDYEADMSLDYSNLRFVTPEGNTMPHWVETYDATRAIVWVKVPSITTSSTIYLLYGGASCVKDTWEAYDVFIYYDEMDSIATWGVIDGGAVSASSYDGESVVIKQTECDPNGGWKSIGTSIDNFRLITREQRTSAASNGSCALNRYGLENSSFDGYNITRSATGAASAAFGYERRTSGTAYNSNTSNFYHPMDTWFRTELIHDESGNNIAVIYDDQGTEIGSISGSITQNYTGFDRITLRGGQDYYVDFMAVAQYDEFHPTVSIGSEQQAPLPLVEGEVICSGTSATLIATGATNCDKYVWYDVASGGTALKTSIDYLDSTYTTATLTATTNYWVSTQDGDLNESDRVMATVTVKENDTLAYTKSNDTTIIYGGSATIGINPSKNDKTVHLDGSSNSSIEIADNNLINLQTHSERTIAFWFKAENTSSRQVLYEEGGSVNGFSFYIESDELYFHPWESSTSWGTVAADIVADQWYHAAFVYDGAAADGTCFKAYLDGTYIGGIASNAVSDAMNAHSGDINIGASDGALLYPDGNSSLKNYFTGNIDEFKLWNRPLDEDEVAFEINNRNDGTLSGADMIVYYNFNDEGGIYDLADTNGGSNDGTINGNVTYADEDITTTTYLWTPGGFTDSVITVSPIENTTYTYYINNDGYLCEASGTITVLVNGIETRGVTNIMENTAKLNGFISSGIDIVEYGFYYSSDNSLSNLTSGGALANEVAVFQSSATNFIDERFSTNLSGLVNRRAYYFRPYTKDDEGVYLYGEVSRFISEKRDFSLQLDGLGDALVVDTTYSASEINDWGVSANTFSVEFWLKKSDANTSEQVICFNDDGVNGYTISLSDGDVVLSSGGTSVSSALKIEDQLWHHAVVTYNNGSAVIYVDDSASASQAININKPSGNNVFVGAGYDGANLENEFYGYLDAMRFWNVALGSEHVLELAYDLIEEGTIPGEVQGVASGEVVSSLTWESLVVSLGFNVMSTKEASSILPASFTYESQAQLHDFPFFHNDVALASDSITFNVVACGDAKPSPMLPRVNWRHDATDSLWCDSLNWGGYAYPGQGITQEDVDNNTYSDVTAVALVNDSVYCEYAIINNSMTRPVVDVIPPEVQVLVDRDSGIGTYYVNDTVASELTVLQRVVSSIFGQCVANEDASVIIIEEGALEVE